MGLTGFSKTVVTIYLSTQCNIPEQRRRGLQDGENV